MNWVARPILIMILSSTHGQLFCAEVSGKFSDPFIETDAFSGITFSINGEINCLGGCQAFSSPTISVFFRTKLDVLQNVQGVLLYEKSLDNNLINVTVNHQWSDRYLDRKTQNVSENPEIEVRINALNCSRASYNLPLPIIDQTLGKAIFELGKISFYCEPEK